MILGDRLIDDVPLAILDTETTGLESALGHRIIEIAILRLENWQEVGQINQLVNPGRPIPYAASRVNKIFDNDVAAAPPFADYAGEIETLLDGALVVAHNARFDAGFIAAEWTLTDRGPLQNPCACTLELARRRYNFWRNNLSEVARSLGIRPGRAHRAMNDVWMTAQVFRRMLKDLNHWGIHTVGELMHAQGGPIYFPPPPAVELPEALEKAIHDRNPIGIRYAGDDGEITDRIVEPYFMGNYKEENYLVAFCRLRNAQRTFRLDRIVETYAPYPG